MSNRFLGEATAELHGRRYTLRCDFNAMCEFEDATGKDALATFEAFEAGKVSVKDMRAIMWSFMLHHHPDATLKEAGELLSADVDVLMKVIKAASPSRAEAAELGNAPAGPDPAG
ncbi:GTA-gp10 family protein [Paracoccus seriniphilus]|uniref:Phage tail tube protein, GTA-gp10 n=1 Tax=Paracoccus seriniphilus TaxID=184748 RepID=A0A239Q3D8_9RHOB|nr:GTA-gp10 family protein [Paracoccus seriniphilus]WCR13219.1 gene transfer agent family protein [Paracoccus seriniphilus]SNT76712.1 Phage tail tube protein, GTA-gp10 [Paracoccus seriniphilus]